MNGNNTVSGYSHSQRGKAAVFAATIILTIFSSMLPGSLQAIEHKDISEVV